MLEHIICSTNHFMENFEHSLDKVKLTKVSKSTADIFLGDNFIVGDFHLGGKKQNGNIVSNACSLSPIILYNIQKCFSRLWVI
jgi:hypothetical protein